MIYVHNLDPVIFSIWGDIALRWYSLAYIAGFVFAWYWLKYLIRRELIPLEANELDQFGLNCVIGLMIGARLGYVVFYDTATLLCDPLEILRPWHGGMSFHGGLIGLALAILIWSLRKKRDVWALFGAVSLIAPAGLFFGRIANFINGELWGRPTDGSWGVVFPAAGLLPRHPSQLYEMLGEGLFLYIVLNVLVHRGMSLRKAGPLFLFGYGLVRFIIEFFREPDRQLGFVLADFFSMGQILCLAMMATGIILFFFLKAREKKQ